jgi:hypothetical protein
MVNGVRYICNIFGELCFIILTACPIQKKKGGKLAHFFRALASMGKIQVANLPAIDGSPCNSIKLVRSWSAALLCSLCTTCVCSNFVSFRNQRMMLYCMQPTPNEWVSIIESYLGTH